MKDPFNVFVAESKRILSCGEVLKSYELTKGKEERGEKEEEQISRYSN